MQVPEQYRKAGKVARETRQWILENAKVGGSALELAAGVEEEIRRKGGEPAFPTGIGVNEVTAHYAPQEDDATKIGESDLVKIDYGVHVDGYIADTAVTVTANPRYQLLLETTRRALQAAVDTVKHDVRTGEIGRAIEAVARQEGFKTINNLSGHTLEQYTVHAGKSIPNLYTPNLPALKRDDVFAIEPFLTLGDAAGYVVDDDTRVTIYSLAMRKRTGSRELDGLVERVWGLRKSLPFTPRWFSKEYGREKLMRMLRELEKLRVLRSYPTLVEASKAPVAQFEHTMAIEGSSVAIFT